MKTPKIGWKYALLVLGIALLIVLVMDFNSRTAELRRLTNERQLISAKVTQQLQTKSALEGQIAYATSDAAVREWAYQEGHMVRPGDNPVVPLPDGDLPAPTPTPAPTQVAVSNWEQWLSLFVGSRTP